MQDRDGAHMDLGLAGKVVLVTGGGQGLGRAIGAAFAAEGAKVGFAYNSSAAGAAEAAAAANSSAGGHASTGTNGAAVALAVKLDITSDVSVAAGLDLVEAELGPIDILVNNAAATQRKPFLDTTAEDWAPQVDVTVTGMIRVTHAVAQRMVLGGRPGSIVSLMGDSGRVGESGLAVTATTRASTMALTKSLAKELARYDIRANCVSLGLVQTDHFTAHAGAGGQAPVDEERLARIVAQYPLRRLGRAEDVTPIVLLLASPASSWTTGQVLSVNGGYAMAG